MLVQLVCYRRSLAPLFAWSLQEEYSLYSLVIARIVTSVSRFCLIASMWSRPAWQIGQCTPPLSHRPAELAGRGLGNVREISTPFQNPALVSLSPLLDFSAPPCYNSLGHSKDTGPDVDRQAVKWSHLCLVGATARHVRPQSVQRGHMGRCPGERPGNHGVVRGDGYEA